MVSLKNINLMSRSECQFGLTPGQDIGYMHYTMMLGRRFLATKDGEDSVASPLQRTHFTEPSA